MWGCRGREQGYLWEFDRVQYIFMHILLYCIALALMCAFEWIAQQKPGASW